MEDGRFLTENLNLQQVGIPQLHQSKKEVT